MIRVSVVFLIAISTFVSGCASVESAKVAEINKEAEVDKEAQYTVAWQTYLPYAEGIRKSGIEDTATALRILGRPNRIDTAFSVFFSEWTYYGSDLPTYDDLRPQRLELGFNRKDELEAIVLAVDEYDGGRIGRGYLRRLYYRITKDE